MCLRPTDDCLHFTTILKIKIWAVEENFVLQGLTKSHILLRVRILIALRPCRTGGFAKKEAIVHSLDFSVIQLFQRGVSNCLTACRGVGLAIVLRGVEVNGEVVNV